MKQPTIEFRGSEYKVRGVHWSEDGTIGHVSFLDEDGKLQIAFHKTIWDEEGFDSAGHLNLDLNIRLKEGE